LLVEMLTLSLEDFIDPLHEETIKRAIAGG
jgi:hypothetical protein